MSLNLSPKLLEKYNKLKNEIEKKQKIIIAYSGGVDSALLAKIAHHILGDSAIAVFLNSETVPKFELESARQLAHEIGIELKIFIVNQLSDERFIKNDKNRCYYCRSDMAQILKDFADTLKIETIAAGAQATDLGDYRPGIKAFEEVGIWHPFIEFDFSKDDVRQLAKYLQLPVSDKPSMACLSSRVEYGHEITENNLKMIEAAEDYLRDTGFTQYRARILENTIRIEIIPNEFEKIFINRNEIISKMKELGFVYVTLDLEGFRSGSGNEILKLD
jgi:uncharacterized protein